MKLELYHDVKSYLEATLEVLAENEIQNNIIIGNCLKVTEGQDISNWLLAAVKDGAGRVRLVAMMTPPFNLCLYEAGNVPDDSALDHLVKELETLGIEIPGVITEKSLAARFSDKYRSIRNKSVSKVTNMRAYRLDKVDDIPVSTGSIRLAGENDLFYLPYWFSFFSADCGLGIMDLASASERAKGFLNIQSQYIWEDVFPVSMALVARRTMNCAVVSYVYTPPFLRGKGYASSCVAGLSRHLLESGFKSCSLFTDLSNPISNSIYMKIGYKPVCDFDEYKFSKDSEL